jgi:hypothetical protein|tara:strand:- start:809 stop:1078 length:270 start_codon:yes stop_codon:yes gene_type:complete
MELYDRERQLTYKIENSTVLIRYANRTIADCEIIQDMTDCGTQYINFKGPNSLMEAIEIEHDQIVHIRVMKDKNSFFGTKSLQTILEKD